MARGRKAGVYVETKGFDKLSEIEAELVMPLVEVAKQLKSDIKARVRQGIDNDGQAFSALGAHSVDKEGKSLFWIPPGRPHPAGFIVQPSTGQFAGWAAYKSYRDYARLLGKRRTFFETGQLLESLAINVKSESEVRLYFQGSRRTINADGKATSVRNRDIAYANSFRESDPLLTPSTAELTESMRIIEDEAAQQILGVAAGLRTAKNLRKRGERLSRRVSAASRGR